MRWYTVIAKSYFLKLKIEAVRKSEDLKRELTEFRVVSLTTVR